MVTVRTSARRASASPVPYARPKPTRASDLTQQTFKMGVGESCTHLFRVSLRPYLSGPRGFGVSVWTLLRMAFYLPLTNAPFVPAIGNVFPRLLALMLHHSCAHAFGNSMIQAPNL